MLANKPHDFRIRWVEGERLDHLFEDTCDQLKAEGKTDHPAIIERGVPYGYYDIDNSANQMARHLIACGVRAGDRVALLLDRSKETYVALLAVMKINAAYVPLDGGFPDDRIGFILQDANINTILTSERYADRLSAFAQQKICIDIDREKIRSQPTSRLKNDERAGPVDELCYIIYTSGTTGKPKGVAIEHSSICNFVRVAAETYGIRSGDRVFQGMTIAFDFSVEELWVPLMAGATLVPNQSEYNLVGDELAKFLKDHQISVLCCVPTLLATIENELPDLRVLLVSGEACPQDLVTRWHKPGRKILNAYGPTEATVTATLTELYPDKPVTIGSPLPSYSVVILSPDGDKLMPPGEVGEIGIAGIGLARGYVNRDDLTEQKFIPDFADLPANPSKRIYKSGDIGRINHEGEIEYLGRIDTQVKIRGYRIELGEIESALLQIPEITQAAVNTHESEQGLVELAAYYSTKKGARELKAPEIADYLRSELPPYMIPVYFEKLTMIPMTSANKADRKSLPAPKTRIVASDGKPYQAPRNEIEKHFERALSEVLNLPRASIEDNFFDDLGANSLLMARFCSAVRGHEDLPNISMREVYLNPTISELACFVQTNHPDWEERSAARRYMPTVFQYYGCGVMQLSAAFVGGFLAVWALLVGHHWIYEAIGNPVQFYTRIVITASIYCLLLSVIPIATKWLLIGRWRSEKIPIWSFRYFRFWVVKGLVAISPLNLFRGTPLYNQYLRLLGARIGKDSTIYSPAPVCTDMFSVGDNVVVRERTLMPGYFAEANILHTGAIKIANGVYVGADSVLEPDTNIGRYGQLAHSSTLKRGMSIPAGKRYHGTPAVLTEVNFRQLGRGNPAETRGWIHSMMLLVLTLTVILPLSTMGVYHLYPYVDSVIGAKDPNNHDFFSVVSSVSFPVFAISVVLPLGILALRFLSITLLTRLLNAILKKDRIYPLYGIHHSIYGLISRLSKSGLFNVLFGDSSLAVGYLKLIGYRLSGVIQTGANFGMDQKHDNPFLCSIGSGTMVSDGLRMANIELSNTSFRLRQIKIGRNNYIGNNVLYPAAARTGDNVLLANKVMVPIDGEISENVGLLGSPCIEIPRAAEAQCKVGKIDPAERSRQLRKKNRFNLVTLAWYLAARWMFMYVALVLGFTAIAYYPEYGGTAPLTYGLFMIGFTMAYWIFVERASLAFGRLKATSSSMYDRDFLRHERHWKFCAHPLYQIYSGTPFKNLISRLSGVRVGTMVFDDGASLYDKTLLEIGDYVNLNKASVLQAHSLEDGNFKSGPIRVGDGSSIGCGAFIHYNVEIDEEATLGANAFVMKGETIPAKTIWEGNPARAVTAEAIAEQQAVEASSAAETWAGAHDRRRRSSRDQYQKFDRRKSLRHPLNDAHSHMPAAACQ